MKRLTRVHQWLLTGLIFCMIPLLNAQEITKKKGKVVYRYENGNKSSAGRVSDYRKTGSWKYWDEQGDLHHTATYVNDTLHGPYVEYDRDESVTVIGNFSHGLKSGVWRFYYTNGQPAAEHTYADGRLDGRQITWYENGEVHEVLLCESDRLISRKVWYPGGRLRLVENYKNGVSDGVWITYPDPLTVRDTFPSVVDEYSGGQLHGWHYAFQDGQKMEEVHYSEGQTDGKCTRWDEHGHLQSIEIFTAGKRNGSCRYYDCNGVLRDVTYTDGVQTGPQVDYDRNGDTLHVTWFTEGRRDSIKTFHANGIMATRRVFATTAANTEHSEYSEWDTNGVRLVYGRYIGDMRYGEWYTYYADGTRKSLTTYSNNGDIAGPYVKWYPNGKRMIEFSVLENGATTPPLVWTEKGRPMRKGTTAYNQIVESAKPAETYNDPVANRHIIDKRIAETTPPHLQFEAIEDLQEPPAMIHAAEENMIYANADIMPEFPGGLSAMQAFIDAHLVHPAVLHNMQGTVLVSYVVEKDGSLSNIRAVQEVKGAPEFTIEALRVVRSFPKMQPAVKDGNPVRCRMIVPIQFNAH